MKTAEVISVRDRFFAAALHVTRVPPAPSLFAWQLKPSTRLLLTLYWRLHFWIFDFSFLDL